MIAKANAFDYLAFADVEARDDASGKNGRNSSGVIRSSRSALPLTAAATPICAIAARSAAWRTPPEACHDNRGKRDRAVRYRFKLGPDMAPSRSMSVHSTCLTKPAGKRLIASHRLMAVPSFQPCVHTRGSSPESIRISSARQIRSLPNRVNHSATSSGRWTAALPTTTRSTALRRRSSMTAGERTPPPT